MVITHTEMECQVTTNSLSRVCAAKNNVPQKTKYRPTLPVSAQ